MNDYFMDILKKNDIWFVNCAISLNGMLSKTGEAVVLSNEEDWAVVHKLRSISSAIVVGANTIRIDDPSLSVKSKYVDPALHPVRVILDRSSILDSNYQVYDTSIQETIIVSDKPIEGNLTHVKYRGVEFTRGDINDELGKMGKRCIVMVEGGSSVISQLLITRQIDYLRIFRSTRIIGDGLALFDTDTYPELGNINLKLLYHSKLGDGMEEIYQIIHL